MDDMVRIGRVSSIDYATGMVSVAYGDRDTNTTIKLPMLSNGLYRMPAIGAMVAVLHQGNGSSHGVVLGTVLNKAQGITGAAEGIVVLDLANGAGATVQNSVLTLKDGSGSFTVQDFLNLVNRVAALEAAEGGG